MTPTRVAEHTSSEQPATVNHEAATDHICPAQGYREPSWLQRRAHRAIIFYQRAREGRPSPCRFFPSCSAYALEAIDVHGTRRGGWLAARRLLRCRPLGPSGFDPVPEATITCPGCDADAAAATPRTPHSTPTTPPKGS